MIVNVRGTGGAGKSTIARAVMARYECAPQYIEGRKQPIGYICQAEAHPPLYVVGHYETPTGGGDTISNVDDVFTAVRERATYGYDVFFEGIISQDDVTRTAALHLDGFPITVIFLDVPIEDCLAGIQARRDARGETKPLNPKNTVNRLKSLATRYSKLKLSNVPVVKLGREAALAATMEALGWSTSSTQSS